MARVQSAPGIRVVEEAGSITVITTPSHFPGCPKGERLLDSAVEEVVSEREAGSTWGGLGDGKWGTSEIKPSNRRDRLH